MKYFDRRFVGWMLTLFAEAHWDQVEKFTFWKHIRPCKKTPFIFQLTERTEAGKNGKQWTVQLLWFPHFFFEGTHCSYFECVKCGMAYFAPTMFPGNNKKQNPPWSLFFRHGNLKHRERCFVDWKNKQYPHQNCDVHESKDPTWNRISSDRIKAFQDWHHSADSLLDYSKLLESR